MRWSVLILLGFVAGCGETSSPSPIYLGHVGPATGVERETGRQATLGIRLAIAEFAKAEVKPFGRPVHVIHADTKGEIEAYDGEAIRLVKINRVMALYGGQTLAEVERLERARATLITPAGLAARDLGDLVFSIGMPPDVQGKSLARFVFEELKTPAIFVVQDMRSTHDMAVADAFIRELSGNAIKIRGIVSFGKDAKHAELAKKATEEKVDALLFAGSADDFDAFRKALPAPKPMLLYGGSDGALSAPKDADAVITATAFAIDPNLPKTQEFAKKFREEFERDADVHAALAYDGIRILVEAMRQDVGAETLVDDLGKLKDFAGLTGEVSFGTDRILRRPTFITRLEQSGVTLLKRWPR